MSQELLNKAVQGSLKTDIPEFGIGDTVSVQYRIVEGEKERIQAFTGTVIARKGGGISETFRVRRIVAGQGVERTFPLHNPRVADVEIVRRGAVRRAKLNYLRKRVGKATRVKDKRVMTKKERLAAEAAAGAQGKKTEPLEPQTEAAEQE
ncbi:MAG: 50S ribosomal protein L19 [Planctomycetota bacterium]